MVYSRHHCHEAVTAAYLETRLVRAKAHALQAQIQPHFLFNTLNSIAMLVREGRGAEAVEAMASLGAILRSSMNSTDRVETSLDGELRFIEDYLRLEQFRLDDRLVVRYDIDPEALGGVVPTMLLQPLVENALRHGLADLEQGGAIRVVAARANGHVDLTIHDTGRGFAGLPREGIGLRNVRERLRALHGEGAVADLLVVGGNPLEDLNSARAPTAIILRGRVLLTDSLP